MIMLIANIPPSTLPYIHLIPYFQVALLTIYALHAYVLDVLHRYAASPIL